VRHVVFRLHRDRYALPLASVREVIPAPERLTWVPRAPSLLKGVMNLRGRVVPIIDLRALVSALPGPLPPTKVVLLDRGRRELGLLTTDVDGIETVEKISPPAHGAPPFVRGLSRVGALALTVLDPEKVDVAVAQAFNSK
jgi:purine-binding chemotaxis protein CheW